MINAGTSMLEFLAPQLMIKYYSYLGNWDFEMNKNNTQISLGLKPFTITPAKCLTLCACGTDSTEAYENYSNFEILTMTDGNSLSMSETEKVWNFSLLGFE